ncbi:hypothetical protein [Amycolatopsis sp. DG1A-15b]|uniref:hypothetical protein n=1 Tax=Amycolatopsis sp. DG1A-15b TaxID=3052846 RepID=UPI00255B44B1|nr:hypothetical protein [Amycolatopsis sp. DG1A-15b]WIX90405.1 hypothetical protein QRY02_08235 [Amycolatopsis sp. DG1A-15b]
MRTFRQTGVIVLMAITFSVTGVAVATGFDVVVVTTTVDGKAGHWEPGRSAPPAPTPAIEATTPSATPSAEPVIPGMTATTATSTSSTPTEVTASPSEPAPTTEP